MRAQLRVSMPPGACRMSTSEACTIILPVPTVTVLSVEHPLRTRMGWVGIFQQRIPARYRRDESTYFAHIHVIICLHC